MPELPEVETIVSDLNRKIKGARILSFWSDFPKAIKGMALPKFKREMQDKKIIRAERVGKNIFLHLSGEKSLHIHLRMTGHLLIKKQDTRYKKQTKENTTFFNEKVNQYIHHVWQLDKDRTLEFSDLRKFATMWLMDTKNISAYLVDKKIGIDAMDEKFTLIKFNDLLDLKPAMPIGIFLLDQSLISGIGNIYRSEILFSAGVLPERKNESLDKNERKKNFREMRRILKLAIKMRGTSDSDYRDSAGAPGHFQEVLKVYRKTGAPCPDCFGKVQRKTMAQRSVFFCPKCQK